MHAEHIERVIGLEPFFEAGGTPVAHHTGHRTNQNGAAQTHKTRCGRDGHQPGHAARAQAQQGGAAPHPPLRHAPGQRTAGCGDVRDQHGQPGPAVSGQGRSGIEPKPAHPQQAGARHRQAQVEGGEGFASVAQPGAQGVGRDQGRRPGVDVNDGTTGKVECAHLCQPAARLPHPVGHWGVHQQQPQPGEPEQGGKAHPLHQRTHYQGTGDDGKRQLEHGKHRFGQVRCNVAGRHLPRGTQQFQPLKPGP